MGCSSHASRPDHNHDHDHDHDHDLDFDLDLEPPPPGRGVRGASRAVPDVPEFQSSRKASPCCST
ncbi:hypothetical protein ESCO_006414 [Escovopsis weberi]|uniref:Uncharacterized protein n=1 Tax=Escovopsis weberi TaxID=150374 RepID=A0A0M9VS38_ESCWE|nr:hypothetical protein ESCO_006414 [Escovopsis weberi]